MNETDALYALGTLLTPPLGRVVERGKRGQTLEPWGLQPHRADPGTPMAKDDEDGYDSKIPEGLTGTVLFPIVNATDALASIQILLETGAKRTPFKHHTPSFLSSCRTAFESSAQAIWIMSPEDRDSRRARAAGLARIGTEHAREFQSEAINAHDNKLLVMPDKSYEQSKRQHQFYQDELDVLDTLPQQKGGGYTAMVRKAANWLQDNPPFHTTDMDGKHFPTIMKQQYRVCSSFTHGHSWPTDLVNGPSALFAMMADAIATAVISTECAIALFEAQSTDPASGRTNHYPDRLQPTIDGWRDRYL
ncbi:hypothetical protein I7X09_28375 [Rhodococcus sp. P-2]|uniref:hypothetical protein n=1 Tax=Rhodococcus sp. P-2 TaxID=2795031 RepID=UPI0019054748|nr:hypothetical protein [Rhodococcus sp. P-2]QQM21811.1 hypothetical protein I7X09_28375 [Rhodococcus sp. P-2]